MLDILIFDNTDNGWIDKIFWMNQTGLPYEYCNLFERSDFAFAMAPDKTFSKFLSSSIGVSMKYLKR